MSNWTIFTYSWAIFAGVFAAFMVDNWAKAVVVAALVSAAPQIIYWVLA